MIRFTHILLILFIASSTAVFAQADVLKDLKAEVNQDGHVVLTWSSPPGQLPWQYQIARGNPFPDRMIAQIYNPTTVQFTDYNVEAGAIYTYGVAAIYSDNSYVSANVTIKVVPPAQGLQFVSRPKTTAMVGDEYVYAPAIDVNNPGQISYMLINEPDGMVVKNVVGGSYISWVPERRGEYNMTLVATNWVTFARAIQEFSITVSDKPGSIQGIVRTLTGDPMPEAELSFWQVAQNGMTMKFHTISEEDGSFELEHVQPGRIYAYCKSPTDDYQSQWYINAASLPGALERTLRQLGSLTYDFYLIPKSGFPAPVTGRVTDNHGQPITDAHVSFIRKEDFIHIGDTAGINSTSFEAQFGWRSSVVDTFVTTDFDGRFQLNLAAESDYYTFVEQDGYLGTFIGDETNALQARAQRIPNSGTVLNYTLPAVDSPTSTNQIIGQVRSQASGVSKQATIVLIDSELKRGAGGGHTYKTYKSIVTDSNGVFQFRNLAASSSTSLLAIPMDPRLAPQYYHENGGRMNFIESQELPPNGTIQNIDFELQETVRSGIGSFYGKVVLRRGIDRIPLPGTLVIAEHAETGKIAGYAITDSTGTYSITGMESEHYLLYADNPAYSYRVNYSPAKPSEPMPVSMTYVKESDMSRISQVNFFIDDLKTGTGIETNVTPESVALYQNYPNPFNPSTTIHYSVPRRQHVTLRVFSTLGEEIAVLVSTDVDPGYHAVEFDASNLPSGIYFYQLQSEDVLLSKRMMLVK